MSKIQVNHKLFEFLQADSKRFNYLFGGAGSGKSWGVAQYLLIEKLMKEPASGVMAVRRTKPEVKASCLRCVLNQLDTTELLYDHNKTEQIITLKGGGKWYFDSVDDVLKKKSLEGINYLWIEESTEFTWPEWLQLNLRVRAKNKYGINRIFATFNPEDPIGNAWLKKLSDEANSKEDSQVIKINHNENPFLSKEERRQIEELASQDAEYDKIYRLGEWATPTFIIYTNWDIVSDFPECDDIAYGLDFGYNNPSALIKVGIKDKLDVYLQELIYEDKLTNADLLGRMPPEAHNGVIMADSSEPARIEEFRRAGYNIHGVKKAGGEKGWLRTSIDQCKKYHLHILADSPNLQKELRGYKWKQDKEGNPLDEPVKFRDHLLDAFRYVLGQPKVQAGLTGISIQEERYEAFEMIEDESIWR